MTETPRPPDDLAGVIAAARAAYGQFRVVDVIWQGRKCWLKQIDPDDTPPPLARLHARISPMLPRILRTTQTGSPLARLHRETARQQRLHAKNLPVPAVLAAGEDWMLTADAGEWMNAVLARSGAATRHILIDDALMALQAFHKSGEAHGRPMIKDCAIAADGRVSWLDLEEDTRTILPLPDAIARDILTFLLSLTKWTGPAGLAVAVDRAVAGIPPQEADAVRRRLARGLRLLAPFGRDRRPHPAERSDWRDLVFCLRHALARYGQ